jgi:hypothetical protein
MVTKLMNLQIISPLSEVNSVVLEAYTMVAH